MPKKTTKAKSPRRAPPPLTEGELSELFDECNRTRFGGTLPKTTVSWVHPPGGLIASMKALAAWGPSIWISPVWALGRDRQWVRPILLHEMAHVEVGQSEGEPDLREHGALWRAAMMRLYAQGEDWVSENLRKAADKERDEDRLLAPMFTEMTRLPPTLSWDAVCEHLLKKFGTRHTRKWGLSARDLIERSPRLLAFWIDHARERVVADP